MNKIELDAKEAGLSLVGWQVEEIRSGLIAVRLSRGGMVCFGPDLKEENKWVYSHPRFSTPLTSIKDCMIEAEKFAEESGGWAGPAIGYGLKAEFAPELDV